MHTHQRINISSSCSRHDKFKSLDQPSLVYIFEIVNFITPDSFNIIGSLLFYTWFWPNTHRFLIISQLSSYYEENYLKITPQFFSNQYVYVEYGK